MLSEKYLTSLKLDERVKATSVTRRSVAKSIQRLGQLSGLSLLAQTFDYRMTVVDYHQHRGHRREPSLGE